ncbi:MAG: SGNH/GDSL hydrolase family protein [SAR324 cluster bacterium]|uniref:SGNH/GDSL hydrolase family protein n=1 Tax=SAR324 cluster bacterium TaxID=2024889 RepID=A0A7X9IL08_9DELT|nr:SGNH/GDSL hydrolase family protein [SAR324 cluster bacterium]
MMKNHIIYIFLVFLIFGTLKQSVACPRVDNLNDFNCDGIIKFVFVGDSIVYGKGDTRLGNKGGYVQRLKAKFPNTKIQSIGLIGYSSGRILSKLKKELYSPGSNKTKRALRNADFILLDEGRNDYWENNPASLTARDISRTAKLLTYQVGRELERPPYIAIAYLLPTKRIFQRTFIAQVNDGLELLDRNGYNVDLAFNKLDKSLIGPDGIHPTSAGYERLTKILTKYLKSRLQMKLDKISPPDPTPTPIQSI